MLSCYWMYEQQPYQLFRWHVHSVRPSHISLWTIVSLLVPYSRILCMILFQCNQNTRDFSTHSFTARMCVMFSECCICVSVYNNWMNVDRVSFSCQTIPCMYPFVCVHIVCVLWVISDIFIFAYKYSATGAFVYVFWLRRKCRRIEWKHYIRLSLYIRYVFSIRGRMIE